MNQKTCEEQLVRRVKFIATRDDRHDGGVGMSGCWMSETRVHCRGTAPDNIDNVDTGTTLARSCSTSTYITT
jgi:hypothetical protein